MVGRHERMGPGSRVAAMWVVALASLASVPLPAQAAAGLATAVVVAVPDNGAQRYGGVVEAVRQTVVSAQVAGTIVAIRVKAGDRVRAGQVLVQVDARAADQDAAAHDAQVRAARADLDVARRQLARRRELFRQGYISPAAMDRAQARFRATQAQVDARLAQAGAARTQSGFYIVKAPYAGVVSSVPVTVGDLAMPGRPLLTVYDPTRLRVRAAVPQSVAERIVPGSSIEIELPRRSGPAVHRTAVRVEVLPAADPETHTVEVRAYFPRDRTSAGFSAGYSARPRIIPGTVPRIVPGTFARLDLPVHLPAGLTSGLPSGLSPDLSPDLPENTGMTMHIFVPVTALVVRTEMTGLYVLDAHGDPLLRQVRLGRRDGDRVEVLAGISPGDRIVLDPQAVARVR